VPPRQSRKRVPSHINGEGDVVHRFSLPAGGSGPHVCSRKNQCSGTVRTRNASRQSRIVSNPATTGGKTIDARPRRK
jgi:hypothetical protein